VNRGWRPTYSESQSEPRRALRTSRGLDLPLDPPPEIPLSERTDARRFLLQFPRLIPMETNMKKPAKRDSRANKRKAKLKASNRRRRARAERSA
jgi:hypothetical protein